MTALGTTQRSVLPFCKQTEIPRLKSASEIYNFRLSINGKLNRRLAEVFAAAGRMLQIWRRLRRPHFFRDPDIRRRLGCLFTTINEVLYNNFKKTRLEQVTIHVESDTTTTGCYHHHSIVIVVIIWKLETSYCDK